MKEKTCLTHPCLVLAPRAEARLQSPATARRSCTNFSAFTEILRGKLIGICHVNRFSIHFSEGI